MATIKFYIQSKNNPAGIYVRLRDGSNIDAKAKTTFAIDPKCWSSAKGKPITKSEDSKKLDEDLESLKMSLLSKTNANKGLVDINSQWLSEFIKPQPKLNAVPKRLIEYIDFYAEHKKNEIKPSSYKKIGVNKNLLIRFELFRNHQFSISEINEDFKLSFDTYCLQNNYSPNTIARAIKFIKTICLHARRNGIVTHQHLDGLRKKTVDVDKVTLSIAEIEKIEAKSYELAYLDHVRDWLIISCETGQRVSDFMRFKKEMIKYRNEMPMIEFRQVKTGKLMALPLTDKILEILQKRNGEFPKKISDQKYNEYIKEVCKIAGLTTLIQGSRNNPEINRKESGKFEKWQLVTSHIGRRSYATNNYGLIPTSSLMYATGHSTEKQFLEYVGKEDTDKALELANHYRRLNKLS